MFIYKITNLLNNKVYIGQTIQKNPYKRINFHFKKNKLKYKSLIRDSINKYGKTNFNVEILGKYNSIEELNQYEKYFINKFNCLSPNGYNLQLGGQTNKFSLETRLKMSKTRKGRPASGNSAKGIKKSIEHRIAMSISRKGFTSYNRKLARKISAEKLNISLIATNIKNNNSYFFNSIKEASLFLNIDPTNISRVINKKQNRTQSGGYRFEKVKNGKSKKDN